jgi:hypothetical protein
MSDPITTGPSVPLAEVADLAEQARDAVDDDVADPDLADLPFESDPADVVEQRLEVGYDDDRDGEASAS